MKILLVSTLKRKIHPNFFASRSRIIYEIASGLVKNGHDVTILATGDSQVDGATIIPIIEKGWVDLPPCENQFLSEIAILIKLNETIKKIHIDFDVIHNHTYPDFFPSIIASELARPLVTTLHALHDTYMDEVLSTFPKTYYISLSNAYQKLYSKTNFFQTVYNGVDTDLYKFSEQKQNYLFWLGRMPKGKNPDGSFIDPKGVRYAIQLAKVTGSKLYISATVEDIDFFNKDVRPHLNDQIQFIGNPEAEQTVSIEKIIDLYRHAKAFLMTINQFEPFGLVMAEAMSCGTPVIGFDRGAVAEVVQNGKTGFIVPYEQGVDGLKEALDKIGSIQPSDCRAHVVNNFSIQKMVQSYEIVYNEVIEIFKNQTSS